MLNFIYIVQSKWYLQLKISVQGPFNSKVLGWWVDTISSLSFPVKKKKKKKKERKKERRFLDTVLWTFAPIELRSCVTVKVAILGSRP